MNSENYFDGSNYSANNKGFQHTIEIMRAASPYLSSEQRPSIDLFVKFGDLMSAFTNMKQGNQTLSAQSSDVKSMDIEGLLGSIRNISFEKERKMIDMFLNFFKARRMFDTFNSLSQLMSPNQDMDNFSNFDINNFATMFQAANSMFGGGSQPTSNFHANEDQGASYESTPPPMEQDTNRHKTMAQDLTSNSDIIYTTEEPFDDDTSSEFSESFYYNGDYNQETYHSPSDDDYSSHETPTEQFYSDNSNYDHKNLQKANANKLTNSTNNNDSSTYTYTNDNNNPNNSHINNDNTFATNTNNSNTSNSNNSNSKNNLDTMMQLLQSMQKGNNSNNMNDVLGNLLTPEQKTTYETISTLMNTM